MCGELCRLSGDLDIVTVVNKATARDDFTHHKSQLFSGMLYNIATKCYCAASIF